MKTRTIRRRYLTDAIAAAVTRHGSLRRASRALGFSASYLSDLRLGRREAGKPLLRKLGLKSRVVVERTVFYDLA